jgi:imidazolonepropionase
VKVFRNFNQLLTLKGAHAKDGRNLLPTDVDIIENGTIVFDDDIIHWVGADKDLPAEYKDLPSKDYAGKVCTPELVDSHTHLVFGGNRSKEYTMRLNGADYQAIAKAGGGILNTMKGTGEASEEELFTLAKERIERIASYGVGTIEIKSGYGLTIPVERLCTEVIQKLKEHFKGRVQIFNTYLAAHAVPKKYKDSNEYLNEVVLPLLEELAPKNIIDAVDIFHEEGYFSADDVHKLFGRCKELNIPVKIHADEFNDNAGATIASEYQALSADHLLCTGEAGIKSLANSQTVATLLPGTGYFLGKPQADGKKLLEAGAKVAIASDYNPGSCHWDNLLAIAALAAPLYKMNICELWSAITLNSAHALGFREQGAIVKGLKPRFSVFDTDSIDMITYSWGRNYFLPSF